MLTIRSKGDLVVVPELHVAYHSGSGLPVSCPECLGPIEYDRDPEPSKAFPETLNYAFRTMRCSCGNFERAADGGPRL